MNLNKLSKLKWHIEHFDGCPAFTEMTVSGFTSRFYKSNIPVYTINTCYYHERQGDWMTLPTDQKHIGSYIVRSFIKNPQTLKFLYKDWLRNFDLMMRFFYEIIGDDLSVLSNKELWQWAERVYRFYRKISLPGFIDGYMFYADKRFDEIVKDFCEKNKIKNYPRIYSALSAPVEPSFIYKENDDLIKIAKIFKAAGFKRRENLLLFLKKKNGGLRDIVSAHLLKYYWIKSSYFGWKEYSLRDMENEIKDILKDKDGDGAKIFHKHKREKEKLIKKYKFNMEILAIAKITEILVKWQDQRKIYTLTFISLQEKIIREMAKRSKINLELLRYSRIADLKKILIGKMKISELKKRQKSSLFIYQNGQTTDIYTGEKAKKFFKKVSTVDIGDVKEIKGMTVAMGKVRGIVKVITSIDQLNKVKKGDILVAAMTRPEHLAGMKKAAAVVTDDGGITCHAAIVARELGVPCVIGTKIATKVLRDGQLIEVDANKGIVKILKRAQ